MKTLTLILYTLFYTSCFSQQSEEYLIAQMTLEQLNGFENYRLVKTPENSIIKNYLNGFSDKEFKSMKFNFKNPVDTWAFGNDSWGKEINDNLEIIDDFDKLPKVHYSEQSQTYIKLSNPAFSEDGRYVIINVELLTKSLLRTADSYMYIFKKHKGEWRLYEKFTSMLY